MPTISRFLGIIITMYFDEPNPPHFHAKYNEHKAVFLIKDLTVESGSLPAKVESLVKEWAEEHQEELLENWELALNGEQPKKIKPLV